MKGSAKLISVNGVTLYLHFTCLIFVIWTGGLYVTSGWQWTQLLWSLVFVGAIFFSILLHEFGHALVASDFGITAKRITLYPIGGIASLEKLPESPRQELLISIAGPFVSFCIGALLLLFSPQKLSFQNFDGLGDHLNAPNFLYTLGFINIGLGVFNLLPAFPMDGGRMLRALLALKYNYIKATVITASVGKVIAMIIIIAGLVIIDYMFLLVGVFILLFARSEDSYLSIKSLVRGLTLKEVLMWNYESVDAGIIVREAADFFQHHQSRYFMVLQEGQPVGTINRMDVLKAIGEMNYDKTAGDLMKENSIHLRGGMFVEDFLDKFSGNVERIYPVLEEEQFLGVVSYKQIIEYILIHKASSKQYNKDQTLAGIV